MRPGGTILASLCLAAIFNCCTSSVLAQDALWRSYFAAAQKAYQGGQYEESEKLLNSAAESARKMDDSLTTYYYLGRVLERRNDFEQAEKDYRTVLEYLGPKVWATLRPPDGTPAWDETDSLESEKALSIREFLLSFRHIKQPLQSKLAKPITTVDVLTNLGFLYQDQHRNQEAEQMLRQALVLSELRTESIPLTQPRILQRLAVLYTSEGRKSESDALLRQLDDLRNKSIPEFDQLVQKSIRDVDKMGKNHAVVTTRLNNLALFCATHGDYGRADSLYSRALENTQGVNNSDLVVVYRNYADLLEAMGRNDDARKYIKQADGMSNVAQSKALLFSKPLSAAPQGSTANGAQ
jgi:tetratricopeptide (TPR) repeat protein